MKSNKKELKSKKIEVSCTQEQFLKISERASRFGMSSSEFGLFTMINSRIDISIGADPFLSKIDSAIDMLENGKITSEEFEIIKKKIVEEIKIDK